MVCRESWAIYFRDGLIQSTRQACAPGRHEEQRLRPVTRVAHRFRGGAQTSVQLRNAGVLSEIEVVIADFQGLLNEPAVGGGRQCSRGNERGKRRRD
jgi:hypothetical protein